MKIRLPKENVQLLAAFEPVHLCEETNFLEVGSVFKGEVVEEAKAGIAT